MPAPDRDGSPLPASGIVAAVAILAAAIWFQQDPYLGSRPLTTGQVSTTNGASQDIDARLWQDPFAAAQQHRAAVRKLRDASKSAPSEKGGRDSAVARDEKERHRVEATLMDEDKRHDLTYDPVAFGTKPGGLAPENTIVVAAMVFGGVYAEEAEQRRRARYAVLSGLNASGFVPDDEQHIGYLELDPPISGGRARLEIVPFEIFRASPGKHERQHRVVVVWLDENAFVTRPIEALALLFSRLFKGRWTATQCSAAWRPEHDWPRLVVLGPFSSTVLADMVTELDACPQDAWRYQVSGIAMYSPTATAPPEQILKEDPRRSKRSEQVMERDVASRFRREGISFVRMRPTDTQLIGTLLQELKFRQVNVDSIDHVAVVSEWDTLYGRALPDAFELALCSNAPRCPPLHRFSYMRGLDGQVPTPRDTDGDKDAKKDAKREESERKPAREDLERPEGNSQYDYMRRLALRIRQKDETLRHESGGARIRAVGVLGSDPYDKGIVMQAIRRELPGALLFTTDLDARFLHPRELRWSRNLIVASGFGLQLARGLQADIPPFRDSDQTSTYLATMVALKAARDPETSGDERVREAVNRWKEKPRVFEVGRTRAHDLSEDAFDLDCKPESLFDCKGIHPRRHTFWWSASPSLPWAFPVVVGVGVGLLFISSGETWRAIIGRTRRIWRWRRTHRGLFRIRLIAVVVVVGACIGVIIAAAREQGAEPFAVLEWISVWPTEMLRFIASCVAIVALVRVCANRIVATRLAREFLLPAPGSQPRARWRDVLSWAQLKRIFATRLPTVSLAGGVHAEAIWKEYLYQSSIPGQAARVIVSACLFLVGSGLLIRWIFTPPMPPVRGAWATSIDTVVLWLSILAFIAVIFAVVDSIRLCHRVTRGLARDPQTAWPEPSRRRFIHRLWTPPPGTEPNESGFFSPWICSWIDVQLVARWTEAIGSLIYYPFVVLGLLLLARSPVFDDWDLTPGLLIVFALSGLYAVAAAYLLRRTAETTRRVAVRTVTEAQLHAASAEAWKRDLLKLVKDEITGLRDGAFAPFMQQPVIKAVLVPLASGLSTLIPLEYILKFW